MPKYYIKSGSLELIYSTNKDPIGASVDALWETNEYDTLDEYFYVDEKSYKNYITADKETIVIKTSEICELAGWKIIKDDNKECDGK